MAHSNQPASKRTTIDLFDPQQAMARLQQRRESASFSPNVPSTQEKISHLNANQSIATKEFQPFGVSENYPAYFSFSRHSGISPFSPVSKVAERPKPKSQNTRIPENARHTPYPKPTQINKGEKIDRAAQHQKAAQALRKSKRKKQNRRSPDVRFLLAGSSLVASVVLVGDIGSLFKAEPVADVCQEIIQEEAFVSRDALSQLLSIPERDSKESVRAIVREPYCLLPSVEIRSGEVAEREAYPLAFDPQTWIVLLYEGEEYAGYAFSFQP